jgi:MFS family permease
VLFTGMGVTQLAAATLLTAWVLPRFGANGGYVMLAVTAGLCAVLAAFIPRALGALSETDAGGRGAPPPKGWIALFATLCYGASIAAVSVYVVPLAHQAGLSTGAGRTAIDVSLACQILGGALATAMAGRVRYITVFWFCTLASLATWATYAVSAPATLFVVMSGLGGVCIGMGGPFLLPMTIEVDPSRRTTMQSGAVQLLAGAFGPLLAAFVVGERETHGVLILGAALLISALVMIVGLHRAAHAARAAVAAA